MEHRVGPNNKSGFGRNVSENHWALVDSALLPHDVTGNRETYSLLYNITSKNHDAGKNRVFDSAKGAVRKKPTFDMYRRVPLASCNRMHQSLAALFR